jgi:hypothetical protein
MKVTYLPYYIAPDRVGEVVAYEDLQAGEYAVLHNRFNISYVYYIGDDGYEYEYYIRADRWSRKRLHYGCLDTSEMIIVSEEYIQDKYNTACPWR